MVTYVKSIVVFSEIHVYNTVVQLVYLVLIIIVASSPECDGLITGEFFWEQGKSVKG